MTERGCSVEGCDRPHSARGYCAPHYRRWKSHGDPLGGKEYRKTLNSDTKPCEWEDCDRRVRKTGSYCKSHRYAAVRLGLMDARVCTEPGCSKPELARALCSGHYHHYRLLGVWPLQTDGDPDAWDAAGLIADSRLREAMVAARVNQALLTIVAPETTHGASTEELLIEALKILEGE